MHTRIRSIGFAAVLASTLALMSCSTPKDSDSSDNSGSEPIAERPGSRGEAGDSSGAAAGTRLAGAPQLMTVEGRLSDGVECPVVTTPDGKVYSLSLPADSAFEMGDYVRIEAEMADASICMQGEGHLIPKAVGAVPPPARDRDPARAGGLAVTSDYVIGPWVAKGVDADCDKPDFDVTANANGMAIIETRIDGYPETGVVDVGPTPALQWDEPLPAMPVETRGPDGLAVMPPASGEAVTLAGHDIEGDGVVFVKCA